MAEHRQYQVERAKEEFTRRQLKRERTRQMLPPDFTYLRPSVPVVSAPTASGASDAIEDADAHKSKKSKYNRKKGGKGRSLHTSSSSGGAAVPTSGATEETTILPLIEYDDDDRMREATASAPTAKNDDETEIHMEEL